jgi:putative addiction module component (TIGR02574 family)
MSHALQDALNLSLPERLQLVQDLWDSISNEVRGQVSQTDILEAERRLQEYELDPSSATSWDLITQKLGIATEQRA